MNKEEINNVKQAGKIAKQTIEYAKSIVKRGTSLLEIAEKIESKIIELGGKPAFPVNLSINEIAAHSTPSYDDKTLASGLLKVDIGVQIDGFVADTAFSLDLEDSEENQKLIKTAEKALEAALKTIKLGVEIREIGKTIEKEIKSSGFQPIQNLSGHSIQQYNLHAGITIPNYDNAQEKPIEVGIYAIEPFVTTGQGAVRDGRSSGIYAISNMGNVRDSFARVVLQYIIDEYNTLPFCTRWLHKKFGSRITLALKRLEEAGIIHNYPQLIERSLKKVAQAENTVIITQKEKIVVI